MTRFLLTLALIAGWSQSALAWGNEGHEIIALIARTYLQPGVRRQVDALLAADPDSLTPHRIDAAATWADKYRDSNRDGARARTWRWHFMDLETRSPNLDRACYGHPGLPPGTLASQGPARDCIVDKIDQFTAELANPAIDPIERIVALKFILHLVGDLHQPLHVSDDEDRGGNKKRVSAAGFSPGTLHQYWDTKFVEALDRNPRRAAAALVRNISQQDLRLWAAGTPTDWARDSFRVARDDVYGMLPAPNRRGSYRLTAAYVAMAAREVPAQLSKAGVRLAAVLNRALGGGNYSPHPGEHPLISFD